MLKYLLVEAAQQPGTAVPYLVADPFAPHRYVGVRQVPCASPPAPGRTACGCRTKAAHYEPAKQVVLADRSLRREAAAGVLTIIAETTAPDIAAARRELEK